MKSNTFSGIIFCVCVAMCGTAIADNKKTEAKKHFKAGLSLLKSEDFGAAAIEFEESVGLFPTKGALFNLANCYKATHRYSDAIDTLIALEKRFPKKMGTEMREAVASLREEIESMTARLSIRVSRDGAEVFVNGDSVGKSPLKKPLVLGPGNYTLVVRLEGFEERTEKLRLVSGDEKKVKVELVPLPEEAAPIGAVAEPAGPKEPEEPVEPEETEGVEEPAETEVGQADEPLEEPVEEQLHREDEASVKRSPALLGTSIAGTAATVALGIVAGVFWSKTMDSRDVYDHYLGIYGDLDPGATAYDYTDEEDRFYGKLKSARDDTAKNNGVAVGTTVAAGVMAGVSAVLWVLYAKSDGGDEAEPADVELAPASGGFAVVF